MDDINELFQTDLQPMQLWAAKAESKLDQWEQGIPEGMSTGFTTLDEYFMLVDSELITIAARPSMGKTVLGMQFAENVAKDIQRRGVNECVAVFSAEMSGWSLVHRMAGALAGVNVHVLRRGKGTPADYGALRAAIDDIRSLPIWIDDGSGPTTETMYERLARLQETIDVRLMVFDFLELGGNRAQTEELRVGKIAVALKDLAKGLGIPVVALSQVNRAVENRENKLPTLSDLRYSGQIEQVSDVVCTLMRPEYYIKRGIACKLDSAQDEKGVAYIGIQKNRNGPVTNRKLAFSEERARFSDLHVIRHELNGHG